MTSTFFNRNRPIYIVKRLTVDYDHTEKVEWLPIGWTFNFNIAEMAHKKGGRKIVGRRDVPIYAYEVVQPLNVRALHIVLEDVDE